MDSKPCSIGPWHDLGVFAFSSSWRRGGEIGIWSRMQRQRSFRRPWWWREATKHNDVSSSSLSFPKTDNILKLWCNSFNARFRKKNQIFSSFYDAFACIASNQSKLQKKHWRIKKVRRIELCRFYLNLPVLGHSGTHFIGPVSAPLSNPHLDILKRVVKVILNWTKKSNWF